jgi:hypothetical protein
VNQILEDMLRACILEFPQKWDERLPLAEFSYNNSYQESIKMAPFEALYGRRCQTPLKWSEPGERWFFRPHMVKEMEEKVQRIIHNLKEAQARQKSYADRRRQPLYFQVEDYVYFQVEHNIVGPVLRRRRSSRKKRPSAEAVCVRWPKVPLHEASVLQTDLKIE